MEISLIFVLAADLFDSKSVSRRKNAFHRLLKSDDPRVLVPLLNTTGIVGPDMTRLWLQKMAQLLWNITPRDALALNESRRNAILGILTQIYPTLDWSTRRRPVCSFDDAMADTAVAAIRAVTTLGDAKSRKIVQRIINVPAKTDHEKFVQEVAQECLPQLDAQVAEKADIQKLIAGLLRNLVRCWKHFRRTRQLSAWSTL